MCGQPLQKPWTIIITKKIPVMDCFLNKMVKSEYRVNLHYSNTNCGTEVRFANTLTYHSTPHYNLLLLTTTISYSAYVNR